MRVELNLTMRECSYQQLCDKDLCTQCPPPSAVVCVCAFTLNNTCLLHVYYKNTNRKKSCIQTDTVLFTCVKDRGSFRCTGMAILVTSFPTTFFKMLCVQVLTFPQYRIGSF